MRIAKFSAVLLFAFAAQAQAPAERLRPLAADRLTTFYAECNAYFWVVENSLLHEEHRLAAAKYELLADKAAFSALRAALNFLPRERAEHQAHARFIAASKTMLSTIENRYRNLDRISSKYEDTCVRAVDDYEGTSDQFARDLEPSH